MSLTEFLDLYGGLVPRGTSTGAVILAEGHQSEEEWKDARYVVFRHDKQPNSGLLGW